MIESVVVEAISKHPDYQLLKRVPLTIKSRINTESKSFIATIVDLETMGLDATKNEIIEVGLLSFSFSTSDGILAVVDSYNELNDPGKPIPDEVTKVTGITDEDVKGKAIDWDLVLKMFEKTELVICHNSSFDRNFLELQTPSVIQSVVKEKPFACTIKDINWNERGFESSKLDYLNWKLGFFYDGHRAINDCWATLNLLLQAHGVFDELKRNVRKKETLICAENAPYDKRGLLKARNYRWSDGEAGRLPKCWWICVQNEFLDAEKNWLDDEIYNSSGASDSILKIEITARKRYSFRAEEIL